ncbi:MAG TPA: aquaporin [Candidatus Elarobacter sp.]|jgi:aquaporin Z
MRPSDVARRLAAEAVGTFVLTLVAAGGDAADFATNGIVGHAARYLAPGLTVTAMIFTVSGISGAHINPAVTLAFVVRGVFPIGLAAGYWAAQIVGALLAGLAVVFAFGAMASHGANHVGLGLTPAAGVAVEAVLTAILVTVILGTSEEKAVVGKNAAIAVGFTVAALGLFASPLTGASMNPARSLGPAIATLTWTDWWVYLAGPAAGVLLAVAVVGLIYGPPSEEERSAAHGFFGGKS